MSRIISAFRAFFAILGGSLPEDIATKFGYVRAARKKEKEAPSAAAAQPSQEDGALQLLGLLQQEARLLDFFLEDISGYSDDQVGSAVREAHARCQAALKKYFVLAPVIDGVEGTYTKSDAAGALARDAAAIRFIGNLPPQGKPAGGTLVHKGWRVDSVSLPRLSGKLNLKILAPAELEVE